MLVMLVIVVVKMKASSQTPPSDVCKVAVPTEPPQIWRRCLQLSVELLLVPGGTEIRLDG